MATFDRDLSRQLDEVVALLDCASSPALVAILKTRKAALEARAFDEPRVEATPRPDPRTWETLRKATLKRDGYCCQGCGRDNCRLDVHHIQQLQRGGSNGLVNLITLCDECHARLHPWLEGEDAERMPAAA